MHFSTLQLSFLVDNGCNYYTARTSIAKFFLFFFIFTSVKVVMSPLKMLGYCSAKLKEVGSIPGHCAGISNGTKCQEHPSI